MKSIILASTSPRRNELFKKLGLKFETKGSRYKENVNKKLTPSELVIFLSFQKALNVAKKYKNAVIIGADTVVVLKKKLLGKPKNALEAKKMLKQISGKTIFVITGYTIIDSKSKKKLSRSIKTRVFIKKLSSKEINNYVETKEPLDKAGAFGIQGLGSVIVKRIEGDYFNVVGLPIAPLVEDLKIFGINVLSRINRG